MKRIALVLSVISFSVVAGYAADDATKQEYDKFKGTWRIESLEIKGEKLSGDFVKNFKLVIDGDTFKSSGAEGDASGTFKVDVSKKPKHLDIEFKEGLEKGKVLKCIYELDGDTYKLCLDTTGKTRPTEFSSKGAGLALEVLKREKK
jgi:uncharacterized protein (TIGR03067 family)